MQEPQKQLFLFFPELHPSLVSTSLPSEVRFLDPGIAEKDEAHWWRPSELVLGPEQARRALGDLLAYGEQFSPQDLAALALSDFGSEPGYSSMAIQADLRRLLRQDTPDPESVRRQIRLQAQLLLILAWALEERYTELEELEAGFASSWARFSEQLGLDTSERREMGLNESMSTTVRQREVSWRRLLISFLLLVPEGICLVCSDQEIYEEMVEFGVKWQPLPADSPFAAGHYGIFSLPKLISSREWERLEGLVAPEHEILFVPA
ncbi:MAG: hypothetical protein ACQESV_01990 [Thermodesulfobacteriota bacterium]